VFFICQSVVSTRPVKLLFSRCFHCVSFMIFGWCGKLFTYAFFARRFFGICFHQHVFPLWMFAPHVESYWGTKTFLKYYTLCVLGAGLTQALVAPSSVVGGLLLEEFMDSFLRLVFFFRIPSSTCIFIFPLRAIPVLLW